MMDIYDGKAKALRGAAATIAYLNRFPDQYFTNRVLFDLGLNVGHVAHYMIQRGARSVIGFEPHPSARKQVKRDNKLVVVPSAVMSRAGKMYLSTSKSDDEMDYYCNATLLTQPRGVSREVEVLSLASQIKAYHPAGLKIDVEGSEYDLLLNTTLPLGVKWLCVEFHWLKTLGAYLLPFVIQKLSNDGFHPDGFPRLKIVNGIQTNSYWGFEVVNFTRGAREESHVAPLMDKLRRCGRTAYKGNYRPKDAVRRELFERCYGGA